MEVMGPESARMAMGVPKNASGRPVFAIRKREGQSWQAKASYAPQTRTATTLVEVGSQ